MFTHVVLISNYSIIPCPHMYNIVQCSHMYNIVQCSHMYNIVQCPDMYNIVQCPHIYINKALHVSVCLDQKLWLVRARPIRNQFWRASATSSLPVYSTLYRLLYRCTVDRRTELTVIDDWKGKVSKIPALILFEHHHYHPFVVKCSCKGSLKSWKCS